MFAVKGNALHEQFQKDNVANPIPSIHVLVLQTNAQFAGLPHTLSFQHLTKIFVATPLHVQQTSEVALAWSAVAPDGVTMSVIFGLLDLDDEFREPCEFMLLH